MKVVSVAECFNHNKPKDRWNRGNNTRDEEFGNQECYENQQQNQEQPNSDLGNGLETIQIEEGGSIAPMSKSHVDVVVAELLMLEGAKSMKHQGVIIRLQ